LSPGIIRSRASEAGRTLDNDLAVLRGLPRRTAQWVCHATRNGPISRDQGNLFSKACDKATTTTAATAAAVILDGCRATKTAKPSTATATATKKSHAWFISFSTQPADKLRISAKRRPATPNIALPVTRCCSISARRTTSSSRGRSIATAAAAAAAASKNQDVGRCQRRASKDGAVAATAAAPFSVCKATTSTARCATYPALTSGTNYNRDCRDRFHGKEGSGKAPCACPIIALSVGTAGAPSEHTNSVTALRRREHHLAGLLKLPDDIWDRGIEHVCVGATCFSCGIRLAWEPRIGCQLLWRRIEEYRATAQKKRDCTS
tara:strand:- start:33618 stop:34577 length:960 start_codon:yes stop_codon:yes gene_type:complete